MSDHISETKHALGQYFTTNEILQEKIHAFILNCPSTILEPCVGQGDLVDFVQTRMPDTTFDMYELDSNIDLLHSIDTDQVTYIDFMRVESSVKYTTVIGNPPYVRTKRGNLYIDFIEKCYNMLVGAGELIFIVPSDFFKLTSASRVIDNMMTNGTFTHVFHPNNEKMFDGASIDVIVFRYCKNKELKKVVLYNDKPLHIINSSGMITFSEEELKNASKFDEHFDICVGLVTGKESVFKNDALGNIDVINGKGVVDKYIYLEEYPTNNSDINAHMDIHKSALMSRKIRKFSEKNWYEWGALRNMKTIKAHNGNPCIYICNLTRKNEVAFVGRVGYFGGGLIMLIPKKKCNLGRIVDYINDTTFKSNFMFSGRFKIGHRQISNCYLPEDCL